MKHLLLTLLCSFTFITYAQQIQYGSNNGKYISILNTKVYYEEYGKGTPLLLIHGGAVSISCFEKVIPNLSKQFRVIAVDTPGHGRSQQADSLSYQFMADYFSEFIDALKLDSLYVVGWSDGGIIAILLAADRPEKIKRVIASGAQFGFDGYNESIKPMVNRTSPEIVEKEWDSWVNDYQAMAYKGNDWRDFISDLKKMWTQKIYVPSDKAKKIKARFLIILGDRDIISIAHGNDMYNTIKGSEFLVLPNTTHSVFDQRPELFNRLGIEFLTKK
jgi:pimeloyl-ACP methyl ester carboxylesterase